MEKKAFAAVVFGSIIAGFSGLFIKHIGVPATSMAFVRSFIPSALMGYWILRQNLSFFRGNYNQMLLASGLNAVRTYLFLIAFIYTSITQAIIMLFTWPLFVNILSSLWLKEKMNARQLTVITLTFGGILLIYSEQAFSLENRDFIGMSAGILSAFIYSISFIIYKKEIHNYHRNELIFYQNFLGSIVFLPFILWINPLPSFTDWTLMTTYALLMGILIFNFFFFGLKFLKASKVSLIAYVEIVSAVLTGIIFMKDPISFSLLLGGCSIILGILFLRKME